MSDPSLTSPWLTLIEYSVKKDVSLSTLRRRIKANQLKYKMDRGRYLIFDDEACDVNEFLKNSDHSPALEEKMQKLKRNLSQANEEIAELKMLVSLYEEKISNV